MQLHEHIDQVSRQLSAAAALGDERTREVASALAAAVEPATRLAVIGALSAAADEITAALLDAPGSPAVRMHLDGDEVAVEVRLSDLPPVDAAPRDAAPAAGEPSARISLRLTEALKADVDAAAERDGVSVNTWLTRAATSALDPNPFAAFGPLGAAVGGAFAGPGRGRQQRQHGGFGAGQHISGWIDG